jgi:hypothetical protein
MEDCLTFLTISHNPALIEPDTHGFEAPRKTRGSASSEPAATLLVQQGYSAAHETSAAASASIAAPPARPQFPKILIRIRKFFSAVS